MCCGAGEKVCCGADELESSRSKLGIMVYANKRARRCVSVGDELESMLVCG